MRSKSLLVLSLLGAVVLSPRPVAAQVSVSLRLGKPLTVTAYSTEVHGDWRTNYRRWTPTTVYYYNGNYYGRSVRGGRPVMIYRQGSRYFLPPQDNDWANHSDRRFNYNRRPTDDDYQHVSPPEQHNRGGGGA